MVRLKIKLNWSARNRMSPPRPMGDGATRRVIEVAQNRLVRERNNISGWGLVVGVSGKSL